jgi:hypothetical protein
MRGLLIGTHNLNVHDDKARATPFADVLMFTEAEGDEVREGLPPYYDVDVCRAQRSLVVAWHEDLFTKRRGIYLPAHPGVAKVTPHRGTYAVLGLDSENRRTALVVEWRINGARPPYRRGEATLRRVLHAIHTRVTRSLIERLVSRGYVVHVAGDPNLPRWERAYPYLPYEVKSSSGPDRIGSTRRLGQVTERKAPEAIHPRVSARVIR